MDPRIISINAAVLALALAVMGTLSRSWLAVSGCFLVLMVSAGLDLKYRRDLGARRAELSPKRAVGDRLVRRQWRFAALAPLAPILFGHLLDVKIAVPEMIDIILIYVVVSVMVVYLSGLLDWYWALPRISGIVRVGDSHEAWRRLTRGWLIQRWIVRLLVSAIPLVLVVYVAAVVLDGVPASGLYIAAGLVASSLIPLNGGFRLAVHPPVSVGDVVDLPEGPASIVDISSSGARYLNLRRGASVPLRVRADGLIPLRDLDVYPRVDGAAGEGREEVTRFWAEWRPEVHGSFEPLMQIEKGKPVVRGCGSSWRSAVQAGVLLLLVTAVTVVALALTAARFVTAGAGVVGGVIVIGAAAAGIVGLVHSVAELRRRITLSQSRIPAVPLDGGLVNLAADVDSQRSALRAELEEHGIGTAGPR